MDWELMFFVNSALLGTGLAMDAFTVSLANGLNERQMSRARMCLVAGVYALFQTAMPLAGWFLVMKALQMFSVVQKIVPWAAFAVLFALGGKMLKEGLKKKEGSDGGYVLGAGLLAAQAVSTSVDALSAGFAFSGYPAKMAVAASLIIGGITFVICIGGLAIGKKAGTLLAGKASALGGIILMVIGAEILIKHLFF